MGGGGKSLRRRPLKGEKSEVTWGDKGREGAQVLEFWDDVIYGWSLIKIISVDQGKSDKRDREY